MIITISGQYGSGGNEIGRAVAEKLGYRILDSQLVVRAREIYQSTTGKGKPEWWPSRTGVPFSEEDDIPMPDTAYEHAKFKLETDLIGQPESFAALGSDADEARAAMLYAQTKAIMECIEGGNCVLFGKCSNYILRGRKDALHVFTTADIETRIKRIAALYNSMTDRSKDESLTSMAYSVRDASKFANMSRYTALGLIRNTDERRAACYEFLTGEKWGSSMGFNYMFDCTDGDLDKHVKTLVDEAEKRDKV